MRFLQFLQMRNRAVIVGVSALLLLVTTYADWATGPELSLTVFYVAPVALATLAGPFFGLAAAALATMGWFTADALANASYSHPLVPYWNALVQLLLYLAVTLLVSALQRSRLMQRELMEFIVHDLRSPLTAIRAALKSCRGCVISPDRNIERLLSGGLNSLDRLTAMVNDLLDVARAEEVRLRASLKPIEPETLVANAAEQMRPWAADLGVDLRVETEAGLPQVLADPDLTLRVLINLLTNALKYSPPSSVVTVATRRYNQTSVLFAVTDHGPGVPREWVKRVFGKFAQVEARSAGAAVGSGLGLAFCQMATTAQGGRIWMESEPEVQTIVSVTLPCAR